MKLRNMIFVILMAMVILASGCSSTNTKETAEKDLVSFTLDFIVQQEIKGTANYIQTSGQPWVEAPPNANMIIWSPPVDNVSPDTIKYLKTNEPIKVWLYADNKLVEVADKEGAIQEYRQTHMSNPKSNIWAWGYYQFGIMSLSNNNNEAKIYVDVYCGITCGHGVMYTVKRNTSGKWEMTESKFLWVS